VVGVAAENHGRLPGCVRLEGVDGILRERSLDGRRGRQDDGRHEMSLRGELGDAGAADEALEGVAEGLAVAAFGCRRQAQ
jgi:hypothetical protein